MDHFSYQPNLRYFLESIHAYLQPFLRGSYNGGYRRAHLINVHNEGREQAVHTADSVSQNFQMSGFGMGTYMKAGVNLSSSDSCKCSIIEVIIPAAWKAMFLEG